MKEVALPQSLSLPRAHTVVVVVSYVIAREVGWLYIPQPTIAGFRSRPVVTLYTRALAIFFHFPLSLSLSLSLSLARGLYMFLFLAARVFHSPRFAARLLYTLAVALFSSDMSIDHARYISSDARAGDVLLRGSIAHHRETQSRGFFLPRIAEYKVNFKRLARAPSYKLLKKQLLLL